MPIINYSKGELLVRGVDSYLAAYFVAFLGSEGRQSAALGSWILRAGASSISQGACGSGTTTTRRWHLPCSAESRQSLGTSISSADCGGGAGGSLPAPPFDQLFAQMMSLDSRARGLHLRTVPASARHALCDTEMTKALLLLHRIVVLFADTLVHLS